MSEVRVLIKKLDENAVIPRYETDGAAGFDFHATVKEPVHIEPGGWQEIPFGIAMEIPPGYELKIRSRSGPAFNYHVVAYHGLIDSDYRGELSVLLHNRGEATYIVNPGDRVAQGVISRYETAVFEVVPELSATKRGIRGFGSTGKR
ncbi:MAG: dUTP diphosphatase [Candidatus Saccharibacteria bacterium]|nr:dUTP diphosphatase [Candidatus Saccharibacteria bacterium]